jgi:hypothetical protein
MAATQPEVTALRSFCAQIIVDLGNERISVSAVYHASSLNAFASGSRTTEAVHSDLKKELRSTCVEIENVTDYRIFSYNH